MLRGGVREHAGRVADDDASLARCVEVDVVEPDRVVRDDAQLRAGRVEKRGVDGDRRGDDDAVRATELRDQLERLRELPRDLGRHTGRLVHPWPRHAYASSTRGACEDE